jgi:hypothetical protein
MKPVRLMAAALSGIASMAGAAPNSGGVPPLDGVQLPAVTEAHYTFHCGGTVSSVDLKELYRPDNGRMRLADRRRVEFVRLLVRGRELPAAYRKKIGDSLHQYSWLTRVEGGCAPSNGDVQFTFYGMPAEAWADFNTGGQKERPSLRPFKIVVSKTGAVTLS